MAFGKIYATAALGLCLGVFPITASAQMADATMDKEPAGLFVPIVGGCVDAPNPSDCGQVRAVVAECAADLDPVLCDVLFEDPDEVFADPLLLTQAQEGLTQASEAIAEMEFEEVHNEISDIIETTRADSERTLLRGDENLNSHSGPPLATGD